MEEGLERERGLDLREDWRDREMDWREDWRERESRVG